MANLGVDKSLSQILGIGAALVSVFLVTGSVTDPVNATKLFLLGGVAFASLGLTIMSYRFGDMKISVLEVVLIIFIIWTLLVVLFSASPLSQNLYGVYGRNTGFITYLSLSLLFLAATRLRDGQNYKFVLNAFLVAVGVNVVYGIWVILFGDFIGWQNNYGALLGTFGNPNFISSFLGMAFSVNLVLVIATRGLWRIFNLLLLPIILYLIIKTDSVQGLVLIAVGFFVVGFFWLRNRAMGLIAELVYLIAGALSATFGILGALNHGPLKTLLGQPTIALREQYWFAAWKMAESHPLFGVGMDSYGDWYRRARGIKALTVPGVDTVTNAAHNIYLDLLAFGGFPLLLLYLVLIGFSLKSLLSILIMKREFDLVFVSLTAIWFCYHIQALISINQIGLAIWGWLISGLLIGYEKSLKVEDPNKKGSKGLKSRSTTVISPNLVAGLGLVVGLILAVPPLSADMKWREVMAGGGTAKLDSALSGAYLAPLNSFRLAQAVEVLEKSKLPKIAVKYARVGVEYNPQSYNAWQMLYYATQSTPEEKARAKKRMLELDPLNQSIKKLP